MAKIILNRDECIGCGSCSIVCPSLFEIDEKNHKMNLKNAETVDNLLELELLESKCEKEAVEICPVKAIEIKN